MSRRRTLQLVRAGACLAAVGAVAAVLLVSASSDGSGAGEPGASSTPAAASGATAPVPAATTTPEPAASAAPAPAPTPALEPVALRPAGGAPVLAPTAQGVRVVRPADGTAHLDGGFVLAGGAGTDAVVNVGSDGDERTVTRVLVQDPANGETVAVRIVPGAWSPATPVVGGPPEGLSWDGSRMVLQSLDDPGRYVAVSIVGDAEPLVVEPPGTTTFDDVSSDGGLLYVTQTADERGAPVEQIRAVDLRSGRTLPDPVVDKAGGEVAMTGIPTARATTAAFTYTVYVGGHEPFIHALATGSGPVSACLDLPAAADAEAARDAWSIAASADGSTAVAVNGRLGMAYAVRDQGTVVPIELGATFSGPAAVALASPETAYVHTDAGLERLDLRAGTAETAGAAPAGLVALLATPDGVLAVGGGGWEPLGLIG